MTLPERTLMGYSWKAFGRTLAGHSWEPSRRTLEREGLTPSLPCTGLPIHYYKTFDKALHGKFRQNLFTHQNPLACIFASF